MDKKYAVILLILIALMVLGCIGITALAYMTREDRTDTIADGEITPTATVTARPTDDQQPLPTNEVTPTTNTPGEYISWDGSLVEESDNVLFFHASWCPTCKALNESLEETISDIPEGLAIHKLDYDTESDLKKKYGVTYQHTLVQVDIDGNMINKWSGSYTLDEILENIK